MSVEPKGVLDPRMQRAIGQLKRMLLKRYPAAIFDVSLGEDDPESVHLLAMVDEEDLDRVLDVVMERLMEFQIKERLPIHVIPIGLPEQIPQEHRMSHHDSSSLLHQPVQPFEVRPGDGASELLRKMAGTAFQARNLGRAAEIWDQMLAGRTTIILSLSGALVPAGMRKLLVYLIRHRYVDCLVSTGAQLFHDLNESLGHAHFQALPQMDDAALREQRVVRMYDVLADDRAQDTTERFIKLCAEQLPDRGYTTREFLYRLGSEALNQVKEEGVLTAAAKAGIPIFCPALGDSILGTALAWARYEGKSQLQIDIVQDVLETSKLVAMTEEQGGRTGLVILGGGTPRNYAQQSATLGYMAGEGLWYKTHLYAIQITTDQPHWGGLSGATFEEAKSWGKFDLEAAQTVQVNCDATIALPLLAAAVAERHQHTIQNRSYPLFKLDGAFTLTWRG